jgi:hypothetical protein
MRRTSIFFAAVVMLITLATSVSAQTGRVLGARRVQLDDGSATLGGLVWLSDQGGSLGVDLNGNVSGSFPSTCALLDVSSTTKGFLLPRMTNAQELAICGGLPPEGLLVYNLTNHTLDVFNGSAWGPIAGWTLRGNSISSGGTALGSSYIGTNNAQDFVMATNGTERARVTAAGSLGLGTPSPNRLLEVAGASGTPSARFGSLSGAPLLAPPINPANDGIVMGNINGDINKYDIATVVGSVGWLRTGNTILDGNNKLGTLNDVAVLVTENNATVMTIGTTAVNSNVGIKTAPTANWPLTVGTGVASNSTLDLGNEQVNGTFNSQGNSNVGSNAATTNFLGNNGAANNSIGNGAGATNNIGTGGGATNNTIGTSATNNNIGSFAGSNDFGNSAGTNFIGTATGAVTTNNDLGLGFAGATINNVIGSNAGSVTNSIVGNTASAITLDVSNTANNLIFNNIATDLLPSQWLTLNGSNQVRVTPLASIAEQGVSFVNEGGNLRFRHGSLTNAGVPFLANRFENLATFTYNVTGNSGGVGTTFASFNGNTDAVGINNNATNNGATTIGNTTAGGSVSINSSNPNPISINVGATTNNLSLNNINQGLLATDINFLVMTAPTSGNTRWRTLSSFITGSSGVEVTYVGGVADAHFGPLNSSVPFASDRFINTNGFTLHVSNSTPADFVSFNGSNNAVNINNATVGNTNIGDAGGTTVNTIGNSAQNNQIGFLATQNNIGQGAGTNFFGFGATANNFGTGAATTNTIGTTTTSTNNILGPTNINDANGNTTSIAHSAAATTNIGFGGGTNTILGNTTINAAANNNTVAINTAGNTGTVTIGSATEGAIAIQSNANPTAISLNVTGVANNLQLGNIQNGANTDAVFLDMTTNTTGNVRTRTIGSMITGSQGVEVTYPFASAADAHLASNNANVPFTSDRFINAAGFTLHVTNATPADVITFNGATNAVNINNATVGANNIGNGGGGTVNTIGSGANTNSIGSGASFNFFGNNTNQNQFGVSGNATNESNFYGEGDATGNVINNFGNRFAAGTVTNSFGSTGATVNNMGSTSSTNTILGATNINVTGGQTTQIATTTAATTAIGATGGTNTITGNTTINNTANNNTVQINTSTNTGNVTIGNSNAGSGVVSINSNNNASSNSVIINVAPSGTNNLQLLGIANDPTPLNMLSLNAANQVRSTALSLLALEGLVFSTGAFRLGSNLAGGDPADPFQAATRTVSLNGKILSFVDGNGAGNSMLSLNAGTETIGMNNTAVGTNNIGFVGGTNTINGITNVNTTTYNLTTVGNGANIANTQLTVNGFPGNLTGAAPYTNGPNNGWDLYVNGDEQVTNILKIGTASIVVDPTPNSITGFNNNGLTVQTTAAAGPLNLQTIGGGNISLASLAGSGAISITTVNGGAISVNTVGGNIAIGTSGAGTIGIGPTGSGQVTISEVGGHPITVQTVNGALSLTSGNGTASFGATGTGLVTISSTTSNIQTTTTGGNMTFNSSGGGNIQLGNSTTVGQLAAPSNNTTLDVRGSMAVRVNNPALPYNVANNLDYVIICTNAANSTVTLPAATNGRIIVVKAAAAGNVTVSPVAGTIDGAANKLITGGGNIENTFISDGANWWIIGN